MISIGSLGLIILAVVIVILVIIIVFLFKELLATAKGLSKITKDINVISEVSQRRAPDVNGLVDDIKASAGNVSAALKGEESPVQSASSIIKGVTSVAGIIKNRQ